jgi:ribosome maturation factor RimP
MSEMVIRLEPMAQKVAELLEPHIEQQGFKLVWVECKKSAKGGFLRLSVDRPEGGIMLDELESVSHVLDGLLEVYDPLEGSYTLEVSSPGLNRPLARLNDFEAYRGRRVRISMRSPRSGQKTFLGLLAAVDAEAIEVDDEFSRQRQRLEFSEIRAANSEYEFESTNTAERRHARHDRRNAETRAGHRR